MKVQQTVMEQEARQTPQVVAQQLSENKQLVMAIAKKIAQKQPKFVMTIGRGSSDHACTFAKYLFETHLQLPTVSAAPSVLTLYGIDLMVNDALVIGISQSGKSPDICDVMQSARRHGAITVAIVNVVDSPLAEAAEFVLPILAGDERAVAATKSYLGSLSLLLQLIAACCDDKKLQTKVKQLPDYLQQSLMQDWSLALPLLQPVIQTFVLARGFGFPIAQEAALKFKETCALQAESFSGAEVLHGPFALIRPDHPYLMFTQGDNSLEGMLQLTQKIEQLGGKVLLALANNAVTMEAFTAVSTMILPLPDSLHPICDPLGVIQAFYVMVAKLAVERGFNPDAPANLNKVTSTH